MTFTHYVINESLRLASVAPGILIFTLYYTQRLDTYGGSRSPSTYPTKYEDPLTFDPLRWKNIGETAMAKTFVAKNFIAFGGGNRTCAGAEFSKVYEIKGGDVARTPVLEFTDGFYMKGGNCNLISV
ncbi:hypothetical protein DITRI_Ditri14bG0061800 [Diplodiscus trichospermus]